MVDECQLGLDESQLGVDEFQMGVDECQLGVHARHLFESLVGTLSGALVKAASQN